MEIDAAIKNLNAAKTTFINSQVIKTSLVAAIADAKAKMNAATEGTIEGQQYGTGSKATLNAAIGAAQVACDLNPTTPEAVATAVANLNTAVTTFINSKVVLNRTALNTAILDCQTLLNNAVEGTEDLQYVAGSKAIFQTAITTAQGIHDSVNTKTQTDINNAVTALNLAKKNFINSTMIKKPLFDAIAVATNLYTTSSEGTTDGKYAAGSRSPLNTAKNTAQAVLDKATVTQEEIAAATTTLNTAISTFNSKKVVVNRTALKSAIDAAKEIEAANNEGLQDGQFKAGSKAPFTAAIATAQGVFDTVAITQAQADAAIAPLNTAKATFLTNKLVLTTVAISMTNTTVTRTQTAELTLVGKDQNGETMELSNAVISYFINNPAVVSVKDGVVTASKIGSAEITANVTVNQRIVASNVVAVNVSELTMTPVPMFIDGITAGQNRIIDVYSEITLTIKAKDAVELYAGNLKVAYDKELFELMDVKVNSNFGTMNSNASVIYEDNNGVINAVVTLMGDISKTGEVPMIDIILKAKNADGLAVTKLFKESTLADKNSAITALTTDVEGKVAIADADITGGGIEINDLVLVAKAFGKKTVNENFNSKLDMDKSGEIDIRDIAYVALKLLGK